MVPLFQGLKEELADSRKLEICLKDSMAELTRELREKVGRHVYAPRLFDEASLASLSTPQPSN